MFISLMLEKKRVERGDEGDGVAWWVDGFDGGDNSDGRGCVADEGRTR